MELDLSVTVPEKAAELFASETFELAKGVALLRARAILARGVTGEGFDPFSPITRLSCQ